MHPAQSVAVIQTHPDPSGFNPRNAQASTGWWLWLGFPLVVHNSTNPSYGQDPAGCVTTAFI